MLREDDALSAARAANAEAAAVRCRLEARRGVRMSAPDGGDEEEDDDADDNGDTNVEVAAAATADDGDDDIL